MRMNASKKKPCTVDRTKLKSRQKSPLKILITHGTVLAYQQYKVFPEGWSSEGP